MPLQSSVRAAESSCVVRFARFFLVGVLLTFGALGLVPIKDEFSHPMARPVLVVVRPVFLVPGGVMVFWAPLRNLP